MNLKTNKTALLCYILSLVSSKSRWVHFKKPAGVGHDTPLWIVEIHYCRNPLDCALSIVSYCINLYTISCLQQVSKSNSSIFRPLRCITVVDPEQPRFLSLLRDAWLLSPTCWDGLRPLRTCWWLLRFFFRIWDSVCHPFQVKFGWFIWAYLFLMFSTLLWPSWWRDSRKALSFWWRSLGLSSTRWVRRSLDVSENGEKTGDESVDFGVPYFQTLWCSIQLFVFLSIHLSDYLTVIIYLFVYLSIYLTYPIIYDLTYLIYLIYLHLSHLSNLFNLCNLSNLFNLSSLSHLSIYLSIYIYIYLTDQIYI